MKLLSKMIGQSEGTVKPADAVLPIARVLNVDEFDDVRHEVWGNAQRDAAIYWDELEPEHTFDELADVAIALSVGEVLGHSYLISEQQRRKLVIEYVETLAETLRRTR